MRSRDELYAALGDGARRNRFELGANLVDDDDLRHMVLDRLDHHGMLQCWRPNLHAPRAADPRVGDVPVAANFIRRIHDDHPLFHLVGKHTGALAQHGRLADARPPEQEDALSADDHVLDDVDRPRDGPADAAGETDDLAAAVTDGGYAMQRPLDAGAVVVTKGRYARGDELEVFGGDRRVVEDDLVVGEARFRLASEVEDDLEEQALVVEPLDRTVQMRR